MADSFVQVPTDGIGKQIRTRTRVVGGNTVHEHFFNISEYAVQIDDAGSGVTYVGEADPGSLTSAAVWRIRKITESGTPTDTSILWAAGASTFNQIWDNRAALVYS